MRAYIHVFDHPHFATAREDGGFSIGGVPPGTYTLVAWHERFEPVRQKLEVKPGEVKADLKFTRALVPGRVEGRPQESPVVPAGTCCAGR